MKSLPTIVDQYALERTTNDSKIGQMLQALFPEVDVPFEYIFETISFLNETHVNPEILPQIIRGVHNITIGTGKGQVIIHVTQKSMHVVAQETEGSVKTKRDIKL